ncbi:MAG: hypothetical protein MUE69_20630 [Myxococcota bacterium]|nr:hypothetical protein [Myxococcota bacterium]
MLGTEAGMITPIVRQVQTILAQHAGTRVACEIVFPVASESMTTTGDSKLPIVPGPSGGEGCTVAGGCATCPYMKMNSLDALFEVLAKIGVKTEAELVPYEPKKYAEPIAGRTAADLGGRSRAATDRCSRPREGVCIAHVWLPRTSRRWRDPNVVAAWEDANERLPRTSSRSREPIDVARMIAFAFPRRLAPPCPPSASTG